MLQRRFQRREGPKILRCDLKCCFLRGFGVFCIGMGCFWTRAVALFGENVIAPIMINSTISSPQNQRFSLANVSWLFDTREDAIRKRAYMYFIVGKGLSNDDVGAATGTVFQEVRPGSWFRNRDFVKEKVGGATVVRFNEDLSSSPEI